MRAKNPAETPNAKDEVVVLACYSLTLKLLILQLLACLWLLLPTLRRPYAHETVQQKGVNDRSKTVTQTGIFCAPMNSINPYSSFKLWIFGIFRMKTVGLEHLIPTRVEVDEPIVSCALTNCYGVVLIKTASGLMRRYCGSAVVTL